MPTKTSTQTGNWETGATWVGGVAPVPGDDVVILHVVTLNSTVSVRSVDISGNTTNHNLVFTNGCSLTCTVSFTNDTCALGFRDGTFSLTCPSVLIVDCTADFQSDFTSSFINLIGPMQIVAAFISGSMPTMIIAASGSGSGGGGGGLIGG